VLAVTVVVMMMMMMVMLVMTMMHCARWRNAVIVPLFHH